MAFSDPITIDATDYSVVSANSKSTLRANALQDLDKPELLTISHETAASGKVSSVIILDFGYPVACDTTCGTAASIEKDRVMLKVQYNPIKGEADQKVVLTAMIADIVLFLTNSANVIKLLNKEH